MIIYILKENRFLAFEKEPVNSDNAIGNTFADYEAGQLVKLTAAQVTFHEAHPEATAKEVFEKKLTPAPPNRPRGRSNRQRRRNWRRLRFTT
jgi:hypothetical protein